jgi:hypothetical protein
VLNSGQPNQERSRTIELLAEDKERRHSLQKPMLFWNLCKEAYKPFFSVIRRYSYCINAVELLRHNANDVFREKIEKDAINQKSPYSLNM